MAHRGISLKHQNHIMRATKLRRKESKGTGLRRPAILHQFEYVVYNDLEDSHKPAS
jgi:hypothetical protein